MVLHVPMKHPKSGELKQIKIGWSWVLFFFSGFFGLPLFLRRLYVWGGVFFAFSVIETFFQVATASSKSPVVSLLSLPISALALGLVIWLGRKGNEMTAKNLLENDWVFSEPESDVTKFAKVKWGIAA
jgi:hypothetical protein